LSPKFTVAGNGDGSAKTSLGTVDSGSTKTELRAQVEVPSTATSVDSVKLTVTGTSKGISKEPVAAVSIKVTAPAATASASAAGTSASAGTSPSTSSVGSVLPATSLPYLSNTGTSALGAAGLSSLSPGGNASGLFPTLNPAGTGSGQGTEKARAMSDTTALPGDASVAGAQFAGLGALALASILAVTRLSIRRRSTSGKPTANGR
jgi:hypothetical protein